MQRKCALQVKPNAYVDQGAFYPNDDVDMDFAPETPSDDENEEPDTIQAAQMLVSCLGFHTLPVNTALCICSLPCLCATSLACMLTALYICSQPFHFIQQFACFFALQGLVKKEGRSRPTPKSIGEAMNSSNSSKLFGYGSGMQVGKHSVCMPAWVGARFLCRSLSGYL